MCRCRMQVGPHVMSWTSYLTIIEMYIIYKTLNSSKVQIINHLCRFSSTIDDLPVLEQQQQQQQLHNSAPLQRPRFSGSVDPQLREPNSVHSFTSCRESPARPHESLPWSHRPAGCTPTEPRGVPGPCAGLRPRVLTHGGLARVSALNVNMFSSRAAAARAVARGGNTRTLQPGAANWENKSSALTSQQIHSQCKRRGGGLFISGAGFNLETVHTAAAAAAAAHVWTDRWPSCTIWPSHDCQCAPELL